MTARTHNSEAGVSRWHGRLSLFGAALLVSINLCLFGTLEIISSNPAEFDVTFRDVLPGLGGVCLGLAVILTLAGSLVPARLRHGATTILLTLGVLLWIQGSFLRWGYGEFDGKGIDWAAFPWQGWVDVAIWIAVLTIAIRFSRRVSRHALFVAIAFILVQSGALATLALTRPDEPEPGPLATDTGNLPKTVPQPLCQLSSSRNVFHIIMDGFQTDVFMELVAEEKLEKSLDGFVVYRGNISNGNRTVLSVPAVFSTNVYAGMESESEYFRRAAGESFHNLLYQNGYVVNLMPHVAMRKVSSTHYFKRSATYAAPRRMRLMQASTYLLDVSLFRQLPQFMKRVMYNDQSWRLSALAGEPPTHASFHQKAFFRDYINRLEVTYSEPAYHFVHLMPPHGPYVTLEDGSYAGKALPNTRENYKTEARYILRLFMDFIDKLKDLGLYDSSIILLHGDHGAGFTGTGGGTAADKRASWVSALLLLKPTSAHGPLQSSWAQASLADIPATMTGLLGIEHPYRGESIVEMDPAKDRVRRVVFVNNPTARRPVVNRWLVKGSMSDSTSWHQLEPRTVEHRIRDYDWGTVLRFGIAHAGDVYLTSGWSTTSPSYAWSNGNSAEITFGITPAQRDVTIHMVFFVYLAPGKVDRQRIRVSANGESFGEVVCENAAMREAKFTVPREVLQGDSMVVSFELPDAVVPKEIGEGGESRALAMALFAFQAALVPDG